MQRLKKTELLDSLLRARKEVAEQMKVQSNAQNNIHGKALAYEGRKGGYAACLDDIIDYMTTGHPSDPLEIWSKIKKSV